MATKGKGKSGKADKSAKKVDDTPVLEEPKGEPTPEIPESTTVEETTPEVEEPPKEPTPEPVYDEPTLTELIVESYEGEKERGLFEGDGEASFTGGHHYKGMFSEGMMHGRGIYTWADGVTYEGEFTNNQVTGKGVYKWPDGSSYDGDVVNGVRHGIGTFKQKNNRMSYTGDWIYGKRSGKGRMEYDPEGRSFYDGDWVNNIRHGWGTRQYPSGNIYQGMWFNNVRHGDGTMRWIDTDQMYTGQWEDGVQHGMGQHIWFLQRVSGSQYPLRNTYDGEFCRGMRHGYGAFYYANGAKYEGTWLNNMKHGKGKFTFKNGRIYEGTFEKDHISEFPSFNIDGNTTPDITQIRTRTPLPADNMSIHSNDSHNTMGPSLQLEIDHLLDEFTEIDREEEASQVLYVLMRHMTSLKKIYMYYSSLGHEESPDNTFIMNKMQFWRFMKDCKFHHNETSLMAMDRALVSDKTKTDIHSPYDRILLREFLNHLVTLAYHVYGQDHEGSGPVLSWCLSKLIYDNILKNACTVNGYFYYEARRAINALVHMDNAYEVYQTLCKPRKYTPKEPSMKMRDFLLMLKDYKLLNNDLNTKAVIEVLSVDDPAVSDGEGACNLELELTFLEFFEALIGCAQVYVTEAVVKDPNTPRPSTTLTQEQSMMSIPLSPGRAGSQTEGEDEDDVVGSKHPSVTPETGVSPGVRAASSVDLTNKSGEHHSGKPVEAQQSNATNPVSSTSHSDARHIPSHAESIRHAPSEAGAAVDARKSASFVSQHSNVSDPEQPLVQSTAHIGAQSEHYLEEDEDAEDNVEEEELDEETRQFNFWTHQVHIFFVRKFFPAADKMALLTRLVEERSKGDGIQHYHPTPPETPEPTLPEISNTEPLEHISEGSVET